MALTLEEQARLQQLVTPTALSGTLASFAAKLDNTPSATGEARVLDTTFVVSRSAPALVIYTVELTVTLSSESCKLLIDGVAVGEALLNVSLLSGLISLSTTARQQLVGFVPAGSTVQLVTSGGGTVTLVQALELVF